LGSPSPTWRLSTEDMSAKGVHFSIPPKKQDFGELLAPFVDSEGAHCSVGAAAAKSPVSCRNIAWVSKK